MLRVDEVKVHYSAAEERVFSVADAVFKGKPYALRYGGVPPARRG